MVDGRGDIFRTTPMKWFGAILSAFVIILGASGLIEENNVKGVLAVAGAAAGVFLGALLTAFLTKKETEKAKALIESAFERVSTKGRGVKTPVSIPDRLYLYYVSFENNRRYWQFRIIDLHNSIDIGFFIGNDILKSPRGEMKIYDDEVHVLRGRLLIIMTAADSGEDSGVLVVNTHDPNNDRYGFHYHCDWHGR